MEDDSALATITPGRLARLRSGLTPNEWLRVGGMAVVVVALNVIGWGLLSAASSHHYHVSKTGLFGFGTGVLAYTLGMRHAFDADHIAAIDNTTRKLVGDGKRPLSVGYYFSLGHSTVVFLLAVFLNFGIRALGGAGRQRHGGGGSRLRLRADRRRGAGSCRRAIPRTTDALER